MEQTSVAMTQPGLMYHQGEGAGKQDIHYRQPLDRRRHTMIMIMNNDDVDKEANKQMMWNK